MRRLGLGLVSSPEIKWITGFGPIGPYLREFGTPVGALDKCKMWLGYEPCNLVLTYNTV
jgi:hypothetical protein